MATPPTCKKCSRPHWGFHPCAPTAKASVSTVPVQVVHRKREGYRDRADLLEPGTVRMGQTTFAKRRQPGERHGALRPLT
jgi:hypothetical protein